MICEIWERQRDGSIQRCGDEAHAILNNMVMCEPCFTEWARHLPGTTRNILLSDREGK